MAAAMGAIRMHGALLHSRQEAQVGLSMEGVQFPFCRRSFLKRQR
jgi:hypothetical protein